MAAVFGEAGPLAQVHPRYEFRESQIRMAEAVSATIRRGGHLVVEAGTGTGKTLSYLIPALEAGRRCVVSTGTKALQDQLFYRDIPFLQEVLDRPFRAACLKGRANYLCIHRLEEEERSPDLFGEEESTLKHISSWGRRTDTGDVAELPDLPEGLPLWERINARSDTCLGRECERFDDCWLNRAREKARESDIVVVNHHLLLADLAVRNSFGELLPEYDVLIVDEAHRLEEIATHCFGTSISNRRLQELVGDTLRASTHAESPVPELGPPGRALRDIVETFLATLPADTGRRSFRAGDLDPEVAAGLRGALLDLKEAAKSHARGREEVSALGRRAQLVRDDLDLCLDPPEGRVTWIESRGRFRALVSSPIDVSDLLAEHLFAPLHAGILTSATLAVGDSTLWLRQRLGLKDAEELVLPSPFDTEAQSLLYVPDDLPPPSSSDFSDAAAERMIELVRASRGRAFLLFTSYANLRAAESILRGRIGDHPLLVQGQAQKHALLDTFRESGEAILLATASFWEGVDVPGEALSLVVIDKLPFASPGDPLVSARIDAVNREGGKAFMEYQVPSAILGLKQGLGRLLRSKTDRGVLAVLDVRLRKKGYGRLFLESLPECERTGALDDVQRFFDA